MNNRQANLFITDTSSDLGFQLLPHTHKLYPRLIATALARPLKSRQDWELLGRTLIKICQRAHAALQIDVLREVNDFLASLPVGNELQAIGRYYRALVLLRTGKFDAGRTIFEELVTDSEFSWKARAVADVGACHFYAGNIDAATTFYFESQRIAASQGGGDVLNTLKSQWMTAVIRSVQGDHSNALKSLESLGPLVRLVAKFQPAVYYDYLNSLALEHGALNHLDLAEHLCTIALSSPFAPNFKSWSETRDELREAREAVAATVFVNVEQKPQRNLRTKAHPIQTSELAAAPTVKRPIDPLAEIDSILESQLFFDRAAEETNLKYSCVESEIKPVQSISLLLKPHSDIDIQLVSYLGFSITPTSKEKEPAAVQPVTASEARPLFGPTNIVPDNRRPRAPPATFKHRQSRLLIP